MKSPENFEKRFLIFGEDEATHEQIKVVCEDFIKQLYHAGKSRVKSLDELSPKYVSIERVHPTSRVAFYHLLRVHRQINTWKRSWKPDWRLRGTAFLTKMELSPL